MKPELVKKDIELLQQIASYNDTNADLEMQIAVNHKRINELELERKMLRLQNID